MSEELKSLESKLAQSTLSKEAIYEGLVDRFILTLQGYHQRTGIQSVQEEVKKRVRDYMEAAFKEVGVTVEQASRENFEKVKDIVDYEIQLFRIEVIDSNLCNGHNQICEELLAKFPAQ